MKSSSAKTQHSVLRKSGMLLLTAALASMMVPAVALADTGNAKSGSGTYGAQPSTEIGNTAPSTANGDTAFNLEQRSSTYVVGGAGGNGTASCDYLDVLGVDNIGMFGYNWGTKINENPNAFAWNDLMTDVNNASNAAQKGVDNASSTLGSGYCKAAWSGTMTYASVYKYRPQILATSSQGVKTYQTIVENIHKADGNDNYNPTIVTMAKQNGNIGLTALSDTLWDEATAIENLDGYKNGTLKTRYGSPTDIAQDYEAYTKGIQWYILSKHEKQGTLKKVAYVSGYDTSGKLTLQSTDPDATEDIWSRNLEGFEQITENVANTGTTMTKTAESKGNITWTTTSFDDVAKADVIFWAATSGTSTGTGYDGTSNNQSLDDFKKALTAAGFKGEVFDLSASGLAVGHQGFGMTRNLAEYASCLYPEDVKLSYLLKYYWTKFCHVKDEYVDAVMVNQDSSKLLPTGNSEVDLDTTGYTERYMKNIFSQGEKYYLANYRNSNSNCSNYHLQAQGTIAENAYEFGTYNLKNQSIKVSVSPAKIKLAKVKKAKQTATIKVKGNKGKVSYSVTKAAKKAGVSVNSKGKVTIKKGTKKGTYKVTVKAAAKGDYSSATKTVKIVIK